jgi:REP element-mobilizing transposase RayT
MHEGPRRRSIRLQRFDYARPGAYFITICTEGRACLFGEVVDGEMRRYECGLLVHDIWETIPDHHPNVELDAFIVMPNHIHGILIIMQGRGTTRRATAGNTPPYEQFQKPVAGSIPTIIRSFKSAVTKQINELRHTPGGVVWQRNYYEHVVRSERDLNRIRAYIQNNPARWAEDRNPPGR